MDEDERPKPEIIENDVLLDEFIRIFVAKRKKEERMSKREMRGSSNEEVIEFGE